LALFHDKVLHDKHKRNKARYRVTEVYKKISSKHRYLQPLLIKTIIAREMALTDKPQQKGEEKKMFKIKIDR